MPNINLEKPSKPTRQFYWIPVLIFVPFSWLICRLADFNGLYGQDSHEYLRYSKELANYLTGGPDPGLFFWPVTYPLIAAFVSFVIPSILSLQFVSIVSAAICYTYFGKTINLVYPGGTQRQRYSLLFFLCSPFFLRAAVIGMSDMLCCTLIVCSIYHTINAEKKPESNSLVIAILLGILAIQTRYVSGILLLPLLVLFMRTIRKRRLFFFFGIAATVLAITPSIFFKQNHAFEFLDHPWLSDWSVLNWFRKDFTNIEGDFLYTFPNILYILSPILHPGYCFLGIMLLYFTIKSKVLVSKWWLATVIIYLLFLAGIPFQNLRFIFVVFPLVLLLLYPGYELLMEKYTNRTFKLVFLIVILILQAGLTLRAVKPFYDYQKEEKIIAEELNKIPPQELYTFAIDGALRTYEVPQDVINVWTLQNSLIPAGSLFLYNPTRFEAQQNNMPPGKIYNRLKSQGKLTYFKVLPNGWQLYRIR